MLFSSTTRKVCARFINIIGDDYDNTIVYVFSDREWYFDVERQMESSFPLITQVLQKPIDNEEGEI